MKRYRVQALCLLLAAALALTSALPSGPSAATGWSHTCW